MPNENSTTIFRRPVTAIIVAYTFCMLGACFWAETRARHPGIWIVALTASIPIFAAVLGPFLSRSFSDRR